MSRIIKDNQVAHHKPRWKATSLGFIVLVTLTLTEHDSDQTQTRLRLSGLRLLVI